MLDAAQPIRLCTFRSVVSIGVLAARVRSERDSLLRTDALPCYFGLYSLAVLPDARGVGLADAVEFAVRMRHFR